MFLTQLPIQPETRHSSISAWPLHDEPKKKKSGACFHIMPWLASWLSRAIDILFWQLAWAEMEGLILPFLPSGPPPLKTPPKPYPKQIATLINKAPRSPQQCNWTFWRPVCQNDASFKCKKRCPVFCRWIQWYNRTVYSDTYITYIDVSSRIMNHELWFMLIFSHNDSCHLMRFTTYI